MKQIYLTLCYVCFSAITYASQDVIFSVRRVSPVDIGHAGGNLFWDYSYLQESEKLDFIVRYLSADSSKLRVYDGETYYYYSQSNDTVFLNGYENRLLRIDYNIPEVRIARAELGDSIVSSISGLAQYSHRLSYPIEGVGVLSKDASGILTLPYGRFLVERFHFRKNIQLLNPDSTFICTDIYQWKLPQSSIPLLSQCEVHESIGGNDSLILQRTFLYEPSEPPIAGINMTEEISICGAISELSHYPNPVENVVHIYYKLAMQCNVIMIITNSAGLPVYQHNIGMQSPDEYSISVDMSACPRGSYEIHVSTDGQTASETLIKI